MFISLLRKFAQKYIEFFVKSVAYLCPIWTKTGLV